MQGQNYVVAAGYYDDHGADYFGTTASINPAFTLVTDLYVDGGGPTIAFPNTPYLDSYYGPGDYGWYGPNLQVGDAVTLAAVETVPEPASLVVWSLFGLSVGGATWWRRGKVVA